MKIRVRLVALISAACLNACGSSSSDKAPTPTFTVGGTVSGLTGAGLVLELNGGSDLNVAADGSFNFPGPVPAGTGFDVTVLSQPAAQTCSVSSGSGTVPLTNVSNVTVVCGALGSFTIASLQDPLAGQQWHLKNTGQTGFADTPGTPGIDVHVEPAYLMGYTGFGVKVAIVDSGLEIAHEDLAANVVPGGSWNFINNTTDPTNTVDTDGDHGTSVSGLIGMAINTVGGIGVAPRAQLKGFNFLSAQSATAFLDSLGGSTVNPNSGDVFIFNQSFGVSPSHPIKVDPTEESQYLAGVTNLRGGKGALYVKASGNGFNGTICPVLSGLSCENANFDPANTLPYQIVVGAIAASGIRASYSTAGSAIWVSAPGGEFGRNAALDGGAGTVNVQPAMVTTDQSGCAIGRATTPGNNGSVFDNGGGPNATCNYTNGMNGTSSSTPVTVGVIALILESNPALTWRDVKHILASTSSKIDPARAAVNVALAGGTYVAEPAWITNAAGFHFQNSYGFGMIDAGAAVNMAKAYTLGSLGALANTGFVPSAALGLAIPDQSVTGASDTITVPTNPVHVIEAVQIRVSVVHPADVPLLAQAGPGTTVWFRGPQR